MNELRPHTAMEYTAREKAIWRNIKNSQSVCISDRWHLTLFSTKLQDKLKTAMVRVGANANFYDWRPDLKGCSAFEGYIKEEEER